MITDREKLRRIVKRIESVLEDVLDDDYTGEVSVSFKMQNGGVVSKKVKVEYEK